MKNKLLITFAGVAAVAGTLSAQETMERRAAITGGPRDRGQCTVEALVDGVAEIELHGDMARLRTLQGAPAQIRRFECTSPLPPEARDLRFAGLRGRGRQNMVGDPRRGPVVRIEDPEGGAGEYTFQISWGGAFQPPPPAPPPERGRDFDRDHDRDRDDPWYRDRDEWARGGDNWRGRLFERVRDDLDHIQRATFPVGADQYRLVRTKQELNELQGQMASGRFDYRQFDDVIDAMRRVLDDNRLSERNREILRDDLSRLRELRDRDRRR